MQWVEGMKNWKSSEGLARLFFFVGAIPSAMTSSTIIAVSAFRTYGSSLASTGRSITAVRGRRNRDAIFRNKSMRYRYSSSQLFGGGIEVTTKPTVAIIGAGAVGGYYGARIWESEVYDVKFHMRGKNYIVSTRKGFRVNSIDGDIFIPPDKLQAFSDPNDVGTVDWIIVCIKSSFLRDIPSLIKPLLNPSKTRILAIMNGLIEEDLIELMKEDIGENFCAALYGGMALVCSNRLGPGNIDHSFAGLLSGGVAYSQDQFTDQENEQAFRDLWSPTSIDIAFEPSLLGGRWRKCLWNLPFNGISVAMNGITVDKIVEDPGLRRLAFAIMDETVAAANADLAANGYGEEFFLVEGDKIKMMELSDNMGAYRTSTMIDFIEGRPLEVDYLFTKPVQRARELAVPVPHLETIVTQIEAFSRLTKSRTDI